MKPLAVKAKDDVKTIDKFHTYKQWFNGTKHFFTAKVLPPKKQCDREGLMWIAHITDKNFVGETLELTVEFTDGVDRTFVSSYSLNYSSLNSMTPSDYVNYRIKDKLTVLEKLDEFADSLELNVQLKSSQEEAKMAEAAAQADLIQ